MSVGDEVVRMLVRHQWVREHGTPRITILVGDVIQASDAWRGWMQLSGRAWARGESLLVADEDTIDLAPAVKRAIEAPQAPSAVAIAAPTWERWCAGRDDRARAIALEGVIRVSEPGIATRAAEPLAPSTSRPRRAVRVGGIDNPRSLAELTLHEALEATPATAGRFRLNQPVAFRFGGTDAEVDLLAREDEIAIEVDGVHHFDDPERYRRDRRKDLLLQAHGFAVLRFLAEDVLVDPRTAVRMVLELMGHRLRLKDRE